MIAEMACIAEEARRDEVEDRIELAEVVLERRAREREAEGGVDFTCRTRALRAGILYALRLVEDKPCEFDRLKELDISDEEIIARDEELVRSDLFKALPAIASV